MLATLLSPTVRAAPSQSGRPQTLASPDTVPEGLSAPEWFSIRQQFEQHRHAAVPVDGGYQARNPGQQWQTRFDGRGFTTKPNDAAWQWGLELQSYGFAGSERTVSGKPRVNSVGQRVTYDWDATLQEWFVNDRYGLEHGFTVRERPTDRRAELREARTSEDGDSQSSSLRSAPSLNPQPSTLNFLLSVRGGLRPKVQADGRSVRFVDAQGAAALTYSDLTVLDADGRKLPARFEPVEEERGCVRSTSRYTLDDADPLRLVRWIQSRSDESALRLVIDERGARYPLTIDPIAQQAYLKASNTGYDAQYGYGDEFGSSVAVSGDTVVIGAVYEDSSATGVDGDGSDNSAPKSGAAYVFVRNGTTWTQQAYLKASNTDADDGFGNSVAVSGDTVVVGAYQEDSNATGVNGNQSDNSAPYSGAAYVFVRSGTNWSQQAYLKASNTGQYDGFGNSVAMSGDTVVVGASWEKSNATGVNGNQSDNSASGAGAAYVFVRSGTNWTQQAYLKASNTDGGDHFGGSVAVSGDTVVVSAAGEASAATGVNGNQSDNSAASSGAAYVFVRNGTTWTQQAYLKASNTDAGDYFGQSVALSGDTVVVGAPVESSNATGVNGNQSNNSAASSGAAYVFVRNGTTWTQQAYLKAANTGADDLFGDQVAISGDTVVVGAYHEDSNATGVNGNQGDNSATNSGAAYVFVRSGTTWSEQAYLKASNTGGATDGWAGDRFGNSVAVSGGTVVVGAIWEDSNATGVNGDQSNNSASYAGAAYVLTGVGIGPRLALVPDGSSGYFLRFTGAPDITYRLQRAPSVTGPWSAIATNTTPASGLIEYHETAPLPGAAFYRTAQP
ncbi:MAG: FG-GAP repeat protein [Verrucomicrobia bacterium]|nr:FG-GAP repeat protein [Verrucomicrobiota bacterium]